MLHTLTDVNNVCAGEVARTDHELLKATHLEGSGWAEGEVRGSATHRVPGSAVCFTRIPARVHGALG